MIEGGTRACAQDPPVARSEGRDAMDAGKAPGAVPPARRIAVTGSTHVGPRLEPDGSRPDLDIDAQFGTRTEEIGARIRELARELDEIDRRVTRLTASTDRDR